MINIDNLKKELIMKYVEDRAIPVNINISKCGFYNDEILVAFDTMQYSFVERFKDDIFLKDMLEIMDKSIYREDYKYAYKELRKIFNENLIKVSELEFEENFSLVIEQGVIKLQNDRREAKKKMDEEKYKLLNKIADIREKIKEIMQYDKVRK